MPTNFPTALDAYTNPVPGDKLSGTVGGAVVLHTTQHSNHNDAIESLEAKLGINFSTNTSSVDYVLLMLESVLMTHPLGRYKETSYTSNVFPSQIIWYTDGTKTSKLIEKNISYGPATKKFVVGIEWKIYDGTAPGTLVRTITDTITRSGIIEISRTRTVT